MWVEDRADQRTSDRWRRRLVGLLFCFYALLLLEGPLRKWIVPGASNALVFIRDPVMIAIVFAHARQGASVTARLWWIVFAAVLLVLGVGTACQAASTDVPGLALLAGWRNYVLFAPLLWIIPDAFVRADYARWLKLNLAAALPIGLLVVAQYRSPPSGFINAAPGASNDGIFLLVDDIVRPYGLFSFTLGHSAFAAWMVGVALAAALGRRAFGIGWPLLIAGLIGIMLMGAFSGSRTYLLLAGSVLACFVLGSLTAGPPRAKGSALVIAACLLGGLVALLALDRSLLTDILERQSSAGATEGALSDRILTVVTEFIGEMSRTPVFGRGIGAGTNVANFLANGRTDYVMAEYELTRIVQELGPFLGLAVILLRWILVVAFVGVAFRSLTRAGNPQPLCFLGFVAPLFLAHDISLQNSMIGIGWFAAGVLNSAARVGPAFSVGARAGLPRLPRPQIPAVQT